MANLLKIVFQIGMLYVLYRIGEWIADTFNLMIPGSVIGMILLIILLFTKMLKIEWIEDGAGFMVKHLPFFFIPAFIGMMVYYKIFAGKGILLLIIVIFSTALVMVVSGLIGERFKRREE
ncbi:CidA/LrgA family protein [Salinicoccus sp. YB14-2]|uniref:CidA/LrgA family protein n=1 Tax=Salinicoccus sp. YB14-2 TaxID=1572701 RepID=UPI00068C3E4B|nr:CidA/LrgA family holin-like protein [Salinicoccus sp. YB14-2]